MLTVTITNDDGKIVRNETCRAVCGAMIIDSSTRMALLVGEGNPVDTVGDTANALGNILRKMTESESELKTAMKYVGLQMVIGSQNTDAIVERCEKTPVKKEEAGTDG